MLKPDELVDKSVSERAANAVKNNRTICLVSRCPSHVNGSTGFLYVRANKGVISRPLDATGSWGVLIPHNPVPGVFPHSSVGFEVLCSISVIVEKVGALVAV